MNFVEKLAARRADNDNQPVPAIAFLGDSVTQGCFEIYTNAKNEIVPVFDQSAAYETDFSKIMAHLYPNAPITVINAGISGNTAVQGLQRLERDVISHKPDLAVVCFALNDSVGGLDGLDRYICALSEIFSQLKENKVEIIFMTPNMMATEVDHRIQPGVIRDAAEICCAVQRDGVLDQYIEAARKLCKEQEIPVCDCYHIWKQLNNAGVDTNSLLSNQINHPTREMNWLFAFELVKTIFSM